MQRIPTCLPALLLLTDGIILHFIHLLICHSLTSLPKVTILQEWSWSDLSIHHAMPTSTDHRGSMFSYHAMPTTTDHKGINEFYHAMSSITELVLYEWRSMLSNDNSDLKFWI
uniref:Putative serine/arginine-rich splicing factor RS31-like n=1 Tax=Davidia involucrata TaxID=16924 RepID=A0A5B7BP30_DAVIN